MQIELHIDALTLSGFASVDPARIGAAVEAELTRLFTERGLPSALARGDTTERVQAAPLDLRRGSSDDALGRQIAQAVYEGMNR